MGSLLAQLRAAVRPPVPPAKPCPFVFGPWTPNPAPVAPGEAQRPVWLNGALVAWQRRSWAAWVPLDDEPDGPGVPVHVLVSPDGAQQLSATDSQPLLEELAARLGVGP